MSNNESFSAAVTGTVDKRNMRSVWSIATEPYRGEHYSTFPSKLAATCILGGCPRGGVVLDLFIGSGTTLAECLKLGRKGIGIDANPDCVRLTKERVSRINRVLEFEE